MIEKMTAKDARDMMEKLAKQATPQHMAELMIDVEKEYRAGNYKGFTPTQATMIKCRLMYLLGAFEVLEYLTNEGATLSDVFGEKVEGHMIHDRISSFFARKCQKLEKAPPQNRPMIFLSDFSDTKKGMCRNYWGPKLRRRRAHRSCSTP